MRLFPALAIGIATAVTALIVAAHVRFAGSVPREDLSSETRQEQRLSIRNVLSKLSLFPPGRSERALVAVIVENQEDARPHQEGLADALLIEEMVVEGGITRFAVFFDINRLPSSVGPIRSLRPYFVSGALPYAGTIIHAGGSPEAFEKARLYGEELTTVNLLSFGGGRANYRRSDIPAPHNVFLSEEQLSLALPEESPTSAWPLFEEGSRRGSQEDARNIDVNFFSSLHNVSFSFDARKQTYTRTNGGIVTDARPANVLILESPITGVGEFGRLTIPLRGSGEALLFRNGNVIRATWEKEDDAGRFRILDKQGENVRFAKGQTWMLVLPELDRVSWSGEEN